MKPKPNAKVYDWMPPLPNTIHVYFAVRKLFIVSVLHLPPELGVATTNTVTTLCNHSTRIAYRTKAIGRPDEKSSDGRQLWSSYDQTNVVYTSFGRDTQTFMVPHEHDGRTAIANVVFTRRK